MLGVEPFYQCCRYSREELGLEVKNAILERTADESFDVVLLNHVIEHIDDPLHASREVNTHTQAGRPLRDRNAPVRHADVQADGPAGPEA